MRYGAALLLFGEYINSGKDNGWRNGWMGLRLHIRTPPCTKFHQNTVLCQQVFLHKHQTLSEHNNSFSSLHVEAPNVVKTPYFLCSLHANAHPLHTAPPPCTMRQQSILFSLKAGSCVPFVHALGQEEALLSFTIASKKNSMSASATGKEVKDS